MTLDWCPGIRAFRAHWHSAQMLQQTFATMESEFSSDHDACIDAAKGLVECACRVIIDELDDPAKPLKPEKNDPAITDLVAIATRLLKLSDIRHRKFSDLIKHHNSLTNSLRELRNEAGTVSHGKDGFIATLSIHHRRTAILAADTIVTFLHQAYLEAELDLVRTREPYERFMSYHRQIDSQVSLEADVDDDGSLMLNVILPTGDTLPLRIEASRLLYQLDRDAYLEALNAASGAPIQVIGTNEEQGDE